MFTSGINIKFLKTSFIYLLISLFLIIFGAVYEYFSHGVYSYFMIYAFTIPLIFGTLAYFIRAFKSKDNKRIKTSDILYGGSIAVFTTGSITKGVLDIYGTTNSNMKMYPILGVLMLAATVVYKIISKRTISK